jgi:hypothetical protein
MLAFILLLLVQDAAPQLPPPPAGPPATIRQGERRLLDVSRVPAEGRSEADFQVPGWKAETLYRGDLDGDGREDTALQLVEDLPLETSDGVWNERHRALLILLRRPDGSLARAAAATKLLYCSTCGGMLGDPAGGNISAEIKNGVLIVSQLSGSRWASDHTWRFRRDPDTGRFLLIGEDVDSYDRAAGGGTNTSTNYLTGVRVVKKSQVPKGGDEPRVTSTTRARVKTARRFIEDVDYEAQ